MTALIIVIAVLAVVVASTAVVMVGTRRRRGPELEPPPRPATRPPVARPKEAPRPTDRAAEPAPPAEEPAVEVAPEPEVPAEPPRFRDRLGKARRFFADRVGSVLSRDTIDEETWDDLEEALIGADVGVATSTALLDDLRERVKAEGIKSPDEL